MKQFENDALNEHPLFHEADRLRSNLLLTAAWLKNEVNEFLKPYELTLTQFNALLILKNHAPNPISTLHLRTYMLEKMSDTPKIVDRLLRKNLVHKTANPNDRRLVDITISQNGLQLLHEIQQQHNGLIQITQTLSQQEMSQLGYLLSKLRLDKDMNPSP